MVPTLLILSALVFLSVRFIPGDIIDAHGEPDGLLGRVRWTASSWSAILGLDVPIHVQYVRWVGGILVRGTLGDSLLGKDTVEAKIWLRAGPTFQLGLMALSHRHGHRPAGRHLLRHSSGHRRRLRRQNGGGVGAGDAQLLAGPDGDHLPCAVVELVAAHHHGAVRSTTRGRAWASSSSPASFSAPPSRAGTMRITRTMMLEVLRQDYVRTAWAKGLRERMVVLRHAIKNAMIPVLSAIGLAVPLLVGGSVIIEIHLQPAWHGSDDVGGAAGSRLPGRVRGEPVLRHRRAGHQPPHRSALRLPGPAGCGTSSGGTVMSDVGSARHRWPAFFGARKGQRSRPGRRGWRDGFLARLVREKPLGAASAAVVVLLIFVSIFADDPGALRHPRGQRQGPPAGGLGGARGWAPITWAATC